MNRYILIRRLKGPAILLLIGTIALLHQADLVSWNLFVPLLLILIGVLLLAERAALATIEDPSHDPGMYPGAQAGPYPGQAWGAPSGVVQQPAHEAQHGVDIVRSKSQGFGEGSQGGQS